jgi:glucose/arabinose dehydrogenase
VALAALPGAGAGADPPGFEYVRRDTREATREATLARYVTPATWSDWYVVGPFDNTGRDKHGVAYPPEREPSDPAAGPDAWPAYEGKGGRPVRWERLPGIDWERIELKRSGDETFDTDAIAYLYRECEAPAAGELTVETGSDDGLKVWLNGRLLVDADVYRGFNVQDHVVTLPLRAGRNRLLVKVTQGVGGWEFQMRPRHDPRLMAWLQYRLNFDFPESPEARHYRLLSYLEPEGVALEVGGLTVAPDGRPVVATRRGEVWLVDGAYEDPPFDAVFTRFAAGLHEPLGAQWEADGLYVVQRGEVTRLSDDDGDDRADRFETVADGWGLSGNYHEFAFGGKRDGAGRMWVTLNLGFCGSLGKSIVPWRGWALIVEPDGALTPVCGGLRSPNGLGRNAAGDMFYTDNQGDWVATNKLSHLEPGDWHGHPGGDRWYEAAGLPAPGPGRTPKPPAVWFPYDRMGRSASDIVVDETGGRFGPFTGQLFVGDQYAATVMRVCLERVGGVYQGACFPFRSGFDCGVNRLAFAPDGSLLVGMTNRGWWSFGTRPWGLQRVVWTGEVPFEILDVRIRPDGFAVRFTQDVDVATAGMPAAWRMQRFRHHHWERYGSPEIDVTPLTVAGARVGADGRTVELRVEGMRAGFVHELHAPGVRSAAGAPLLHDEAYYTVNVIPAAGGSAP